MQTTAAVLHETVERSELSTSGPAKIQTINVEEPTGDEVLVDVRAASLCGTDVAIATGAFNEGVLPMVMGHECAGVVERTGKAVESVEPGDHVVLGGIACGKCDHCMAGRSNICKKKFEAVREGTLKNGKMKFTDEAGNKLRHCNGVSAFSGYTVVTEDVAAKITDEIPLERATLLGCAIHTGSGAVMNTADIEPNSSVVIFGAGGVGLSGVQGAVIQSAKEIIVVDIVSEKLDIAKQLGATHTINPDEEDVKERIRSITGDGADYAFEMTGSAAVFPLSIEVTKPLGTTVLVGNAPEGKHELEIDLNNILLNEKEIVGAINGSYYLKDAIPELADMVVAGKLSLEEMITDTKSLDEVNQAMADHEGGTQIRQVIRPE
jgi:alcohol dehydrogenase